MKLSDYYKTKHWRIFRTSITDMDDCVCEICNRSRWSFYKRRYKTFNKGDRKPKPDLRIEIHHKHYNTMFGEKREDVLALCHECHSIMHSLERGRHWGPYEKVYKYLLDHTMWEYEKHI